MQRTEQTHISDRKKKEKERKRIVVRIQLSQNPTVNRYTHSSNMITICSKLLVGVGEEGGRGIGRGGRKGGRKKGRKQS